MVVVTGEPGMIGEIFGRIDAGENAEIVDEVGLIKITAVESDVGPANGAAGSDSAKDRLEAANAAEKLGRQSDVMLEEFNETARTEAGFRDHFGDNGGLRGVQKRFDGIFDSGMVFQQASGALEQSKFDNAKFCKGGGGFQDAFTELSCGPSPEVGKRKVLIAEIGAR